MGPGSEEFEDILLLHLQDIETSGHCGVSLWKRRQGTCGHKQPAQPGGDSHPPPPHEGPRQRRPPGAPAAILAAPAVSASSSSPLPSTTTRQALAFPAALPAPGPRHGGGARRGPSPPPRGAGTAGPEPRAALTLTTPCGGLAGRGTEKKARSRVTSIYNLPDQWGAAGRAGLPTGGGAGP